MEEDHSVDGIGESLRFVVGWRSIMKLIYYPRQIACADVVLVNKTDLVPSDQVRELEHAILQVNPATIIHRTVQSNVDLKHIMGIDGYASRSASVATYTNSTVIGGANPDHCHDSSCQDDHDHAHPHHYEARGISSLQVSVPVLTQQAFDRLDEWIRTLLWENRLPEDAPTPDAPATAISVLRCKGIFQTDSGGTYVLQGVRNLYEISHADDSKTDIGVPDAGKLVLIGKGLDERIRTSLLHVFGQR